MITSKIKLPSNRNFGIFCSFIFLLLGIYFFAKGSVQKSLFFHSICLVCVIITIVKADFFSLANKLWMTLGYLLGLIIGPVVLGIIYFGLISPMSLIMYLFGRDELRIKLLKRKSYWRIKEVNNPKFQTFKRPF